MFIFVILSIYPMFWCGGWNLNLRLANIFINGVNQRGIGQTLSLFFGHYRIEFGEAETRFYRKGIMSIIGLPINGP